MNQRQNPRYKVEFPATFMGDAAGTGIIYNLGMGGCKVVSDLAVKEGDILSVQLQIPGLTPPVTIHAAGVRWAMELEFGAEFLGMQERERQRLEQFLTSVEKAVA